ncbi:uncharacterized protein LOC123506660 [Portunus trituberculatus]|uniref:uncharacterized protein LOC123506660 n=1 Tax=Portunus trituberculatus TaxID=210409 RepID=UPI001E1CE95F|nr:uncharacterized protein LOC123506660 [Portunus trituberculatus]
MVLLTPIATQMLQMMKSHASLIIFHDLDSKSGQYVLQIDLIFILSHTVAHVHKFQTHDLDMVRILSVQGIGATGTLRKDRLCGAPLIPKKSMEKKNRGFMEEAFTECTSLVKWKDNKVVCVASNEFRKNPIHKAQRWSKDERKHIETEMPDSLRVYNQTMGSVDLFDQHVSC